MRTAGEKYIGELYLKYKTVSVIRLDILADKNFPRDVWFTPAMSHAECNILIPPLPLTSFTVLILITNPRTANLPA